MENLTLQQYGMGAGDDVPMIAMHRGVRLEENLLSEALFDATERAQSGVERRVVDAMVRWNRPTAML